jgi:hypothetical protein
MKRETRRERNRTGPGVARVTAQPRKGRRAGLAVFQVRRTWNLTSTHHASAINCYSRGCALEARGPELSHSIRGRPGVMSPKCSDGTRRMQEQARTDTCLVEVMKSLVACPSFSPVRLFCSSLFESIFVLFYSEFDCESHPLARLPCLFLCL